MACTGACSSNCTSCSGGCGASCEGTCSGGCGGCTGCLGCKGTCEGSCAGCSGTCSGGCVGDCSGCTGCSGCGSACSTGCGGCTGCSGCGGACSNNCTSCSGGCTGCGTACSAECTGCTGDCTASCDNGCTAASMDEVYAAIGKDIVLNVIMRAKDINEVEYYLMRELDRRAIEYTTPTTIRSGVIVDTTHKTDIAALSAAAGYSVDESLTPPNSAAMIQRYIAYIKELYSAVVVP